MKNVKSNRILPFAMFIKRNHFFLSLKKLKYNLTDEGKVHGKNLTIFMNGLNIQKNGKMAFSGKMPKDFPIGKKIEIFVYT